MALITPAQNPEKKDVADNLATAIARLEQIRDNVVGSTLAQTQAAVRDEAVILLRALRRLAQLD